MFFKEVCWSQIKNYFVLFIQAESILTKQRYLIGKQFTEADVRLFTTLVRFDTVYHTHFKVGLAFISSDTCMVPFRISIYKCLYTQFQFIYQTLEQLLNVSRSALLFFFRGMSRLAEHDTH